MAKMTNLPALKNDNPLAPQTFEQAIEFSKMAANSELVPKDFRNKPGNVLIAMQMGWELGLKPMQALQNISVINGRASVWGDSMLALVIASPLCEWVNEEFDEATMTAICTGKRKGNPKEQIRSFCQKDAEKAKLWGKPGPWTQYPKRMLQMRARGFLLRDLWPDILKGIVTSEEALDIPSDIPDAVTIPSPDSVSDNIPEARPELPEPMPVERPKIYTVNEIQDMAEGITTQEAFEEWQKKIRPSVVALPRGGIDRRGIIDFSNTIEKRIKNVVDNDIPY